MFLGSLEKTLLAIFRYDAIMIHATFKSLALDETWLEKCVYKWWRGFTVQIGFVRVELDPTNVLDGIRVYPRSV